MKNNIVLFIITVIFVLAGYFQLYEKYTEKVSAPKEEIKTENISDYKYYNFTSEYFITVKNVRDILLEVSICIPKSIKGKQTVKNLKFSVEPQKIENEDESTTAVFKFKNPEKLTKITVSGQIEVNNYDLLNALKNPSPEQLYNKERYLSPEQFIESDNSEIIAKAKELEGKNERQTIKKVYYFVQKNMRYDASKDTKGAVNALRTKKGKCSDYSALMTALLRANGIPSRIVSGNIIGKESIEHTRVEVYLKDLGWVEFEPTIISKSKPDFALTPGEYMITGVNTINPLVAKLKIPVKDNRPRPDIFVLIEGKTTFFNPETNEPI